MKRILFSFLALIFTISVYSQPPVTATFKVNLSLYSGTYSNVEFYRGGVLYSMVNTIGNTYEYATTVPFFQASNYSYKFVVDGVAESFNGNELCIGLISSDTLRIINLNTDTPSIVCWQSCSFCMIYGCTDSTASNFNPIATIDDTTCITCNYGCMDSLAINYDSLATCQDTSCVYSQIYGCTDSTACNFNYLANIDDSSCGYIIGCMDSLAYNYDSLAVCFDSSCVYEYNVTFQLDLRGQNGIAYTTPEINGLFNGWCGNCAQMTDINNDSIWEITIPILEGIGPVTGKPGWEYKFSADSWNIQENLFPGDPCVVSAFGYTNRYINVTQDTILDPVCWGSCNDCFAPQTSYNLTFRLDMSQYIGIPFIIPEINGTFNNWCGNCWPMTDDDGDNIWEFTTLIDSSLHEYKFSTDNWSLQELLDSSLYCVTSTIDSSGNVFVNRELKIYSDTILDIACWNECDSCTAPPNSLLNINDKKLSIYPNPSNGLFYIKSNDFIDRIVVYDILSKKLFEVSNPELVTEIDLSNKKANVLLIETYIDGKVGREKLIIIK